MDLRVGVCSETILRVARSFCKPEIWINIFVYCISYQKTDMPDPCITSVSEADIIRKRAEISVRCYTELSVTQKRESPLESMKAISRVHGNHL